MRHQILTSLLAIAVLLLLVSCSQKADLYPWFQGEWISDAGLSMANNPQYDRLGPEDYELVRAAYGKVRWTIAGNIMTFHDSNTGLGVETTFSVEVIDESSFLYDDEWGGNLRIWQSRTGFCMQTVSALELMTLTECFRPSISAP